MCGIAGIIRGKQGLIDPAVPVSLYRTIEHRGPDDQGVLAFHNNVITDNPAMPDTAASDVILLHRRLSIIDLSMDAHQPMCTDDRRFCLVFNGELYNYIEVRDRLSGAGVHCRTRSDTEVVLQAYRLWGPACLNRFIGMFSITVLDCDRRELFLCRDGFGIKPLYYTYFNGNFMFASEMKAFLNLEGFSKTVEPSTVFKYLRWGMTFNAEKTMLQSIRQIRPGHYLVVDIDDIHSPRETCYWRIDPDERMDISFDEAALTFKDLMDKSIDLHMRSDVQIGSALSGGLDSTTLVMAMRRLRPREDIHTFSFCVPGFGRDESRWSSLVADEARTIHHQVVVRPGDLLDHFHSVVYSQDEPFGGTSIIAQRSVFEMARKHGVTVLLNGQGADELLGGYNYYRGLRLGSLVLTGRLIDAARLAVQARKWPDFSLYDAVRWAGSMVLPATLRMTARRLTGKDYLFHWMNREWFLSSGVTLHTGEQFAGCRTVKQCLKRCLTSGSIPDLLRYEDRNSMAFSIESRVPYLNTELAEFVFKLPDDCFIGPDGATKRLLRAAYKKELPEQILNRTDKIGFETPEDTWLKILLNDCIETLNPSDVERIAPVLSQDVCHEGLNAISRTVPDPRHQWRILNLLIWAARFDIWV
jgi:asparagine synthase (glutamine-hydrolysing)